MPQRAKKNIQWWKIAAIVILILTIFSRFYMLGERAVSHDETTHAKYAWNFYTGRGFRHDPLMHGPLLFEAAAFFYFLFGVNDFTARLYTALTGIALVMLPLLFQKWLGKLGAFIASVMLLISPSIAYYSRYTRHDVPMILFVFLLLWAILHYLDTGKVKWLYWMAAFFPLMFATKENAYIYILIFVGLLALPFAWQIFTTKWARPELFRIFIAVLVVTMLLGGTFALSFRYGKVLMYQEEGADRADEVHIAVPVWGRLALTLATVGALGLVVIAYEGLGAATMRDNRLFDVLMTLGTLTLPLGSALFINYIVGADMKTFYAALMTATLNTLPVGTLIGASLAVLLSIGASIALGLWWKREHWPFIALIHYAIFFVFYSAILTHGWGVFTGLMGGLTYWMAQQGVQRGTQPWYYYGIIGPLYEYLPLFFAFPAGIAAIGHSFKTPVPAAQSQHPQLADRSDAHTLTAPISRHVARFTPLFLLIWALLSWLAYTFAGEKMPWLFVHIAFPHILLAAWALGQWLQAISWDDLLNRRGWLLMLALFFLWQAFVAYQDSTTAIRQAFFPGNDGLQWTLEQLQPLGTALGVLGGVVLFGGLVFWVVDAADKQHPLGLRRAGHITLLTFTLILAGFTLRTMIMLNFINFALPTEHMVYAHATPDVKVALGQIEAISWRTTGTADEIQVGYSKEVLWPFMWYMETGYPNGYYFADAPEAVRLLECPVVLAAKSEWPTIELILGEDYSYFDYKYIWWPIEDYKDLTWERIRNAFTDPNWRAAIVDVIRDRDYTRYAQMRNPDVPFTFQTWPHRSEFRLYVRRNLAQEVWRYQLGAEGVLTDAAPQESQGLDPFSGGETQQSSVATASLPGAQPRGLAAAPDGTLYVADSAQHRIWHITTQGAVLNAWGDYGTAAGQFNAPWAVAVDKAGNVYVADTWNHRVQVFDAQGHYLRGWGRFAQVVAYDPAGHGAFFGPRGIAVDAENGRVYVADTGNHRVQVFDSNGDFLLEFGGAGDSLSQMQEPVGIAIAVADEQHSGSQIFIADTGNRRINEFTSDGMFSCQWDIPTWGIGPEDKPYLATVGDHIYVTDPGNARLLAFTQTGDFLWALRDVSDAMLFPIGITLADDIIYVTAPQNAQILGYRLP